MIGGHVGDVTTDSTEFRSKAFNLITVKKKEAVRMVLQLGYHVLFADTDVVITRNPFTYILWPQVDYVHSLNSVCVKDDTWNFYRNREEGNTGFYFARSNNNTIKLWESAIKASNNYPKLDDQAIFWNVIRHTIDPIIIPLGKCNKLSSSDHMSYSNKLTTCHLDPCVFSAGMISKVYVPEYTYEELITNLRYLNESICTLHANYIKVQNMEVKDYPNLSSPQLNSCIVFATDEWFAASDNMISDTNPVWKEDLYTSYGKWMDGWESRRRRTEGHDWCIVKLGIPGIIRGIEVDTAYFTGNFSPKISIQSNHYDKSEPSVIQSLLSLRDDLKVDGSRIGTAASSEEFSLVQNLESDKWDYLIELTPLGAGYEQTRYNFFPISCNKVINYLRINMGPDGGIARIKVYGEVYILPESIPYDKDIDLASIEYGGLALACSNSHYGKPQNLIAPGRGNCMGDGWETARQPNRPPVYRKGDDGLIILPGFDWAILKLGLPGNITSIVVDTNFYKGNYPESCLIEGCYIPDNYNDKFKSLDYNSDEIVWKPLLVRSRLGSNQIHTFSTNHTNFKQIGPISHIRLTIYPDGGVMRLRIYGRKLSDSRL
eukprot:gene18740-24505_t